MGVTRDYAKVKVERRTDELPDPVRLPRRQGLNAVDVVDALRELPLQDVEARQGVIDILAALERSAGGDWQERWILSGADASGAKWRDVLGAKPSTRSKQRLASIEASKGISDLIALDVIHPSYFWLEEASPKFARIRAQRAPEFCQLAEEHHVSREVRPSNFQNSLNVFTKVMSHTGLQPSEMTHAALIQFRDFKRSRGTNPDGLTYLWTMLIDLGIFEPSDSLRSVLAGNRPNVEAMVDLYPVNSTRVREMLIRYLTARAVNVDYSTLRWLIYELVKNFWIDIERHHPGVETLDIGYEAGRAWLARVAASGRKNVHRTLFTVRGLYLDLSAWAHEDPYWVEWAAPSFLSRADTRGHAKRKRQVQAAMHQRIRHLSPLLPSLLESIAKERHFAADLLERGSQAGLGESFELEGKPYRRLKLAYARNKSYLGTGRVWVDGGDLSKRVDVTRLEETTFWSWAIVNTLNETGVRIEELTEITSLALTLYRLPESTEDVPLLQIIPSKTDRERVLLVSPELAHVLAAVKRRVVYPNGQMPSVVRYDPSERIFSDPLPFLFQTRQGSERRSMSAGQVRRLLRAAIARSGILDSLGEVPDLTPHDFRRLFATSALSAGLPIHILAKLLGHLNITTTQGYTAVYDEDTFRHFRTFLDRRRALREPSDYRDPSNEELEEFHEHFQKRKVELGSCSRAYGTPCIHEHACIRCPMLRPDPEQRPRLESIRENLIARKAEAQNMGWFGELEGIEISLTAASEKLDRMQRIVSLGMPGIPRTLTS